MCLNSEKHVEHGVFQSDFDFMYIFYRCWDVCIPRYHTCTLPTRGFSPAGFRTQREFTWMSAPEYIDLHSAVSIIYGRYPYGTTVQSDLHCRINTFRSPNNNVTAPDSLDQSVHTDMYVHHITCYNCCVDQGWEHSLNGWGSLSANTSGDQQKVLNL